MQSTFAAVAAAAIAMIEIAEKKEREREKEREMEGKRGRKKDQRNHLFLTSLGSHNRSYDYRYRGARYTLKRTRHARFRSRTISRTDEMLHAGTFS